MEKCKYCNKIIPHEFLIYQEYISILEFIKKNMNNQNKKLFFLNILSEMEKSSKIEFCKCIDNLEYKKNLMIKLKKDETNISIEKTVPTIFKINYNINFLKVSMDYNEFYSFIKEENKKLNFLFNFSFLIISYAELLNKIKEFYENKETYKIDEIKELKLLVILDFDLLFNNNLKSEFLFFDKKIMEIIKFRYLNKKTTYIIYNSKVLKFEKLIKKINDTDLQNFYLSIYDKNNDLNIKNLLFFK